MTAIKLFLSGLGIWGYVAAAGIAAFLAFGATHTIDALAYGHTIDGLKLDAANQQAVNATAALNQLEKFIAGIKTADVNYKNDLETIKAQFATLKGALANATKKPLPVDCVPDAGRVRAFNAAISAANAGHTAPAK